MSALPPDLAMAIDRGLHLSPCVRAINADQCSCSRPKCDSPGKHPLLDHWREISTTDQEQVARWLRRYPGCNWGICTGIRSGVVVLDVDPYHDGDESLTELQRQHSELPATWTVFTGGGGRHLYFRYPDAELSIDTTIGVVGPGLDIRADVNGLVIAPPSTHRNGRGYHWSVDDNPDEIALANLPEWLLERIARPPGQPPNSMETWEALIAGATVKEAGSGPSARGKALAKVAGLLLGNNLINSQTAVELLRGWNLTHCEPPLDPVQFNAIIKTIASRELARRQSGSHA